MMLCSMTKTPPDHPVRRALTWIVEHRIDEVTGKPISRRALSFKAGLSAAHVGNIINGAQGADIERPTAIALARAGNVRVTWLLTGKGVREPYEGDEAAVEAAAGAPMPPSPPAGRTSTEGAGASGSALVYVDDDLQWCIDHAWKPTEHLPADIRAVQLFGQRRGPLLKRDADAVDIVGGWLDTAARLRLRGEEPTYRAIIDELTRSRVVREHIDSQGRSEDDLRAEEEYREQTGQEPPRLAGPRKPGEPILMPREPEKHTPKPPSSKPKSKGER